MDHLVEVRPRSALLEELYRVHTPEYVAKIRTISSHSTTTSGTIIGEAVHMGSSNGFEIACLSAGGVLQALEDIMVTKKYTRAYCLVRPPGHHAEPHRARGFCVFNNIGIAAAHALSNSKFQRVAVVDYDVHHGNGTECMFLDRSDVLFVSLHQEGLYPYDTGTVETTGTGDGYGYNLNVPLPPGSGIGCYEYAFRKVVLPALHSYHPDIVLVSSGFDAAFMDPLGRMSLRARDFGWMADQLCRAADILCNGKIVFVHEGGYSESYVPYCGLRVLEVMTGVVDAAGDVKDPFECEVGAARWLELQEHQRMAADRAAENLKIKLVK